MSHIHVMDVPGFPQALLAVRRAGGVLLTEDAARQITILAMAAATPFIKAEVLADTSDDLLDMQMHELAELFDQISHHIRQELT